MLQMKLLCSPLKNESDSRFGFNSGVLTLINFGELSPVSPVCCSSIRSVLQPIYRVFLLVHFSLVHSLDLPSSTAAMLSALFPFYPSRLLLP